MAEARPATFQDTVPTDQRSIEKELERAYKKVKRDVYGKSKEKDLARQSGRKNDVSQDLNKRVGRTPSAQPKIDQQALNKFADSYKQLGDLTGSSQDAQNNLIRQTGSDVATRQAMEKQMGRSVKAGQRQSRIGALGTRISDLRGKASDKLDQHIKNYESSGPGSGRIGRAAEQQALKRGLSQTKAKGAAAAAEAAARGESAGKVAEAGAAGALAAKKFQQFRMVLTAIRAGCAISVVGIIVTILIWGVQLFLGHLLGREAWKMTKIELFIALPVWFIILGALFGILAIIAAQLGIILEVIEAVGG